MSYSKVKPAFFMRNYIIAAALSLIAAHSSQAADNAPNRSADLIREKPPKTFSGNASWYGPGFQGKKTASGELFDMNKSSAANLKLPLVTRVLVENPKNGKSTVVRVNDRGPYVHTRIMDLSKVAAMRTGIFEQGVGYIECTVLGPDLQASGH